MPRTGFRIADAYVNVSLDTDGLRQDLERLPADLNSDVDRAGRGVGQRMGRSIGDGADGRSVGRRVVADVEKAATPEADRAGRNTGDKLSRGMNLALIRNSPLIAAAVAGGLTLGAPIVLGAAGALFAGIAAVAVHNNAQIQQAFAGLKTAITSTFTDAAQVTVPFFVGAMTRIGTAVQVLGPQLHQAFAALGGPIDSLTTGLINMAQNALPGIVAAVRGASPVFQGLASLMGSIGTGIGQFFQILSEHSAAAGQVFSSLGQIIGSLLPILGQLIGAGAELAADVLPPVVAILHGVASALNAVAPMLPAVLAGFLAWKGVSVVSGYLTNVGNDASTLQKRLASAVQAVPGLAGALPVVGTAVGLFGAAVVQNQQQINQWAQALLDGGNAAAQASAQINQASQFYQQFGTGIMGIIGNLTGYGAALNTAGTAQDQVKQQAKALYDAMSPLQQKQQDVTKATNELQQAVDDYGASSLQANEKSETLRQKQEDLARAQDDLSKATDGVRKSIVDAANAAYGAINSSYAYKDAQYQQRDAAAALAQAIHDHGVNSDQAAEAETRLEEAAFATAQAFGRMAADQLPATATAQQKADAAAQGTLQSLIQLRDQASGPLRAALDQMIQTVQASGANLDNLGTKHPEPTVSLNQNPLQQGISNSLGWLTNLGNQRPTPIAGMNANPFSGVASGIFSTLASINFQRPNPVAFLSAITAQAEAAINWAARTRYATIYTTVSGGRMPMVATGGQVGAAVGRGFAEGGPFFSGQVHGPGGPMDDLVQAVNELGQPLRVSNREWVINEPVSQRQGNSRMAALNAGEADIVPRRGGMAAAAGGGGGQTVTIGSIGSLQLVVPGAFNLGTGADRRRLILEIQAGLLEVQRAVN